MSEKFTESLLELEKYYSEGKIDLKEYFKEKNRIIDVFINYSENEIDNNNNTINKL